MGLLGPLYQTGDWQKEKHVPVIEGPDRAAKGEAVSFSLSIGKAVAHPNTTEHHIAWFEVWFLPDGDKFPYLVGRFEFAAHGASVRGPNTGPAYTQPEARLSLKSDVGGTLIAVSYCNIHGLWESSRRLIVE